MVLEIIPFALKLSFEYRYGTANVHFKCYGSLLNAMHKPEHSSSEIVHNQVKLSKKLVDYSLKSDTKAQICRLTYT